MPKVFSLMGCLRHGAQFSKPSQTQEKESFNFLPLLNKIETQLIAFGPVLSGWDITISGCTSRNIYISFILRAGSLFLKLLRSLRPAIMSKKILKNTYKFVHDFFEFSELP